MLCEFMLSQSLCEQIPIFVTTLKGLIVGNLEFRPSTDFSRYLGNIFGLTVSIYEQ